MADFHQLDKKILGYEACDDRAKEYPELGAKLLATLYDQIEAYRQEIRELNDLLLEARKEPPPSVPKDESAVSKALRLAADYVIWRPGDSNEQPPGALVIGWINKANEELALSNTADVSRVKHTTLPNNAFESGPTDLPESAFNEPSAKEYASANENKTDSSKTKDPKLFCNCSWPLQVETPECQKCNKTVWIEPDSAEGGD